MNVLWRYSGITHSTRLSCTGYKRAPINTTLRNIYPVSSFKYFKVAFVFTFIIQRNMSKCSVQFTVYVQLLLWLFFGLEYSTRWVAPESERVCQWVCAEINVEDLSTYQNDLYISSAISHFTSCPGYVTLGNCLQDSHQLSTIFPV